MVEPYDFPNTLARLDDIIAWLKSLGHETPDRIRQYRQNIGEMIEIGRRGEFAQLQRHMPIEKAREVLWSYVEADEFVRAVSALRACLGDTIPAVPIKKALSGPADLFLENDGNNEGRNFMFELIVGGRLAEAGFQPSFEQGPDVQFDFAGLRVAIQCKRPLSAAGLEKNIGKAIAQLKEGEADLKLVAVSLSRLLNQGDPAEIPEVESIELGGDYLQSRVRQIADETHRFWSGKIPLAGIYLYAFTAIRSRRENGYHMNRYDLISPITKDELTVTLLQCLAKAMKA